MSGNTSNTTSSTVFHGMLDEKLDNMYEMIKQPLMDLPELREQIADLETKTCALLNPSLCCQIANLEDKMDNIRSKMNTNTRLFKEQKESANLFLAALKSRSANSK